MKVFQYFVGSFFWLMTTHVDAQIEHDANPVSRNFHQINKALYRSGQPQKGELAQLAQAKNVKTILKLNGENLEAERKEAQQNNLNFVLIPLDAHNPTKSNDLQRVLQFLTELQQGLVEGPVLVHCKAGADRTGEVMALQQLLFNESADQARILETSLEMVSLRYSHLFLGRDAKRDLIKIIYYAGADQEQRLQYALNQYTPCDFLNPALNPNYKSYEKDRAEFCQ